MEKNVPDLWRDKIPLRAGAVHKYDFGSAVIYGAPEMTGATRLAASACARIGAGLTTVLADKNGDVYRTILPAHIIVRDNLGWRDGRVSAALYGSGGMSRGLMIKPVRGGVTVLDADALKDVPEGLDDTCVLTPHAGEFARAFPACKTALEAARSCGAIIVLKGAETIIAHPDGRVVKNDHASPFLATAGTGDVLAGMITGLGAQGMTAFDAACAAVWLHGDCGKRAGFGLVAGDLPDLIAKTMKEVLGI